MRGPFCLSFFCAHTTHGPEHFPFFGLLGGCQRKDNGTDCVIPSFFCIFGGVTRGPEHFPFFVLFSFLGGCQREDDGTDCVIPFFNIN